MLTNTLYLKLHGNKHREGRDYDGLIR